MSENRTEDQRFRFADRTDIPVLKLMWQLCFGDEESYIDFYFNHYFHEEKTLLLVEEDVIASMLTMIPANLMLEDGQSHKGIMFYAIATRPDFQNRGLSGELMAYASHYLREKEKNFSVLVPADDALYGFYEKRGYRKTFFIREALFEKIHIEEKFDEIPEMVVSEITAEEYSLRRNTALKGKAYLSYDNPEITYQKALSCQFGGGLYGVDAGGEYGCFIAERVDDYRIIIKELLLPEALTAGAVRKIAALLPADKYLIRTPAFFGKTLGGAVRPFALMKPETASGVQGLKGISPREDGYLGIAFD